MRLDKNIPQKDSLKLQVLANGNAFDEYYNAALIKLNNLNGIEIIEDKPAEAVSFLAKTNEFFIPLEGFIDVEAELKRMREELVYQEGFLNSVMKKLSNERFVAGAPEDVVVKEKQKLADAEAKIKALKEGIERLS